MWYLPLLASAHPCRPVFLLPALESGLLGLLPLLEELSCGLAAHVCRPQVLGTQASVVVSRPGHRALARSSLLRDWFPCAGAAQESSPTLQLQGEKIKLLLRSLSI